jgi:diaminobutyrate-2-oxoglutarate transaminase
LLEGLQRVAAQFPCLGDIRGRGLMVGVEIVAWQEPREGVPPPPFPDLARRIQRETLRRGMIVELGGRHGSVVRFLPPLIITAAQIDEVIGIFTEAVAAATFQPVSA